MDLGSILKKADLSIKSDEKSFKINTKFDLMNKSNIGLLLISIISLMLIFLSIFGVNEIGAKIFLILLGSALLVLSIIVIIKQSSDYVEVSEGKINFSNSLKKKELDLDSDFKIKVKSDIVHVKTKRGTFGSYFCIVDIVLKINNKKFRILDYQVDEKDSKEAKFLGKEIKRMILERVNNV